jgi:hypothetical protein
MALGFAIAPEHRRMADPALAFRWKDNLDGTNPMRNTISCICAAAAVFAAGSAVAQQVTFPLQTNDSVEFIAKVNNRSWYAERRYLSAAPNHATYAMLEGAGPGQSIVVYFFEVDCDLRISRILAISEGLTQDEVRSGTRYINSSWLPINSQQPRDIKARKVCMELALFSGPY